MKFIENHMSLHKSHHAVNFLMGNNVIHYLVNRGNHNIATKIIINSRFFDIFKTLSIRQNFLVFACENFDFAVW